MTVYEAVSAVMEDVQGVGKHDQNTQQGFSFRGIDAVVNAVGPALRTHGVIVAPTETRSEAAEVEVGRNRTRMRSVSLVVTFSVIGPDGDHFEIQVAAESMDAGDKATAKAHSVAYRTALLQLLCIPTDEPDPDATTYERSAPNPDVVSKNALLEAVSGDKARAAAVWKASSEHPMTVGEWEAIAAGVPHEAEVVPA